MGCPHLAADPRYLDHVSRGENQDSLDELIADWAKTYDAVDLLKILDHAGVVSGPVNTVAEVVKDPQLQYRKMFVEHRDERVGRGVLGPGVVPKFANAPGEVRWAGRATPGYDNASVFKDLLNLDEASINDLAGRRII
jgi:formyl-CoA transferase